MDVIVHVVYISGMSVGGSEQIVVKATFEHLRR